MRYVRVVSLLFLAGFSAAPVAQAFGAQESSLEFEALWNRIRENAPALRARSAGVEAARQASLRSELHWIPRIFLDARGFSTNDPGMNFGSVLSQRALQAADFSTASLNNPGTNSFLMAGIGVELPLFEGGVKIATARAESRMLDWEQVSLAGAELAALADAAGDYARLLSLESALSRLRVLGGQLQRVLDRYTVGASGNPVGYSGLLGLKGLNLRVEASLKELSLERTQLQRALSHRAAMADAQWAPVEQSLDVFLNRVLPLRGGDGSRGQGRSAREAGADLQSEALAAWKSAEQARFLPHLGLFGNESLTAGSRSLGTSTTVGIYMRWTLFDPANWGRVAERASREMAARQSALNEALEKQITDEALTFGDAAWVENRKLLLESEQLLSEQVRVSFRLFQSGAIQALPLAEVLNRRVDLVMNLKKLEEQWIQVRTNLKKNDSIEGKSP